MADDDLAYLSGLSEHPTRAGDVSNMNPDFATRLAAAIRQARAAGLRVGLMSGYRDDSTTGSAYDAGGNSSHGYGLASDISGLDGPNGKITNAWSQIAQANGLHNPYGVGNKAEFNHWQLPPQPLEQTPKLLASLKQARSSGDFQNVWSAYNSGGTPLVDARVASTANTASLSPPSRPTTSTPGVTLNSTPMDLVANVESGNQNILQKIHDSNTDRGTPAGGYFQIIDPTWRTYAKAAGVDVDQYPTAMSAPRDIQAKVASAIPVNQWGPNTVAALKANFPGIDTSQTLGQTQSAVLNGGSGAPGPIDPSIIARGGYSPPIPGAPVPGTSIASLPGMSADQSKGVLAGFSTLDKAMGGKGLGGGSRGGGDDEPTPPPMGPAPPIRNMSNPAAFAPALFGNTLNSIQTPPQWSSAPPGQNPYAAAGGQPIGQQFGTQLGSMQQLQQMMAMMGNPYGDAGYG